jgi:MoaA/NifB/PqqE/SkfB family radical SAM enzyme
MFMGTQDSQASSQSAAPATLKGSDRLDVVPAVADVSVTNVCNAACDFCGFARDKGLAGPRRYLDRVEFIRALPILRRRRVRYMTFQGGEPLVHPEIVGLVAAAADAGMQCGLITNGWFLPRCAQALADAGLRRLLISIDSERITEHERNRGLRGLSRHIKDGIKRARAGGIYPVSASVTVSRLLNIEGLAETLEALGFDSVAFSYPRREPLGNTSLVYSENSALLNQTPEELLKALDSIKQLKKRFKVLDPSGALAEVGRFIRGERQLVPCVGGRKYFYIDWNLDIWRCEAWAKPLGSVFDLDNIPDQREPCNACMMSCYRHASVLMHGPLAVTDAAQALARGDVRAAFGSLLQRGVAFSLYSLAAEELPRAGLRFKRSSPALTPDPPRG